jgi:hypothetical protein
MPAAGGCGCEGLGHRYVQSPSLKRIEFQCFQYEVGDELDFEEHQ